jgi:hypothetical protein
VSHAVACILDSLTHWAHSWRPESAHVSTLVGMAQTRHQLQVARSYTVLCLDPWGMGRMVHVEVVHRSADCAAPLYALGVCNALDCVCHFANTNIDKDDFKCIGDQQLAGYGALRGCVVAVKRSQVSGSRPCSFANMMRPPLFLHHAQLWTNPQHDSLVSYQPAHPSSNTPGFAIRHPSSPIAAARIRPLT